MAISLPSRRGDHKSSFSWTSVLAQPPLPPCPHLSAFSWTPSPLERGRHWWKHPKGLWICCHISYLYRVDACRMELKIVCLDVVDPVEGNVEHTIQDESDDVERQEVEVQADHALDIRETWSYCTTFPAKRLGRPWHCTYRVTSQVDIKTKVPSQYRRNFQFDVNKS